MSLLTVLTAGALVLPALALGAVQLPADPLDPLPVTTHPPRQGQPPRTADPKPPDPPPAVSAPTPAGRWAWPLAPPPQLVHRFAIGPTPWSPGHRGVDLAAPRSTPGSGTAVRAPANGIVHFSGVIAGRPVLSIDHGHGLISSLEPVISSLRRGQAVHRDEVLGRLRAGPTHCAATACLHWGVRKDGHYLDPLLFVPARRGPAVLLPLLPS